jgi:hypothetical protein
MICGSCEEGWAESGHRAKRFLYFFPKTFEDDCDATANESPAAAADERDVGVIGGTFIHGATEETPNQGEYDAIIDNGRKFFGIC